MKNLLFRAFGFGLCAVALAFGAYWVIDQRGSGEPDHEGSPARMRLMTQSQYVNTITHIFGPDISVSLRFPPVARTEGLMALGAASVGVTASGVGQFHRMASTVASQVVDDAHRDYIVPCTPTSAVAVDDACAEQFIAKTGRLLYRRPLKSEELVDLVAAAGEVATQLDDFYAGLSFVLAGMLSDPEFLYFIDQTEPNPSRKGEERLDAYSLATRLSVLLWNAAPDEMLLHAAEQGDLYNDKARARIVDAMIASPRLEEGVRAFFDDMLSLSDFEILSKDPFIYPAFAGSAAVDAREQTLRTIVEHLVTDGGDYRSLYITRKTFLSPSLAPIYGMPAPSQGWARYEFPEDSPRAGLLTQIGYLTLNSHPGRSSPTLRGVALREQLLCQHVPDPPPNVDFSALEDPTLPLMTARERLQFHNTVPSCAGCHKITDPIGLALENFDGAGTFRLTENGVMIDTSGELDGQAFNDAIGLGKALHDHPALTRCLAMRVYAYATGGPVLQGDRELVAYFYDRFAEGNYEIQNLLRAIALSDSISRVSRSNATEQAT